MKYSLIVMAILLFLGLCPRSRAQWIRNNGPYGNVYSFAVSDTNLFAGAGGGGVFRSTNNGQSWTQVIAGLTNTSVGALAVSGTLLFAGTDGGFFRSTNNGTSWTAAGLTNVYPQALAVSDTNLFAGTYQSGVFLSTNNGTSWTGINAGLTGTSLYIVALFISGTNLFAGTWGGSAFRSTNNGTTWTSASNGLTSNNVHAFTVSPNPAGGKNLFAGTYFGSGVYLSTDNGGSWRAAGTGMTNSNVRALALSGTNLFAGTDGGGVLLSTNNGTSWSAVNTDLTNSVVNALAVSGTNLFAGTGDGVWRRPLSEMITSVGSATSELPHEFLLDQNYPNPFNPSTTIMYELPRASHVSLTVYDILGCEISVLVNDRRNAGVHEVKFDGSNLSSGVYFYRLQAGSYVNTRKLLLLR